jgi:ATP-binding cassette subfamily B protein
MAGVSPRFVPASVSELSRVGLLATLPGETLTKLAARMEREEILAGKSVVHEGEEGDRFYVILSGLFAVTQGARGLRRMLKPGDVFGEVALAMDVPRTATVSALVPSVVVSCDQATFDEFVRPVLADDP